MEIAGYIAAIFIGITLGLVGSGGSILTVPVLVYLFAVDTVTATSYSLFIVGITAAVGSVGYFRKGLVNIRTAVVFGIPSIAAVYFTRSIIVPAIPKEVYHFQNFTLQKDMLMLLLFAVLMIAASISMIRPSKKTTEKEITPQRFNYPMILFEGTIVGIITGLVGAGGGFLIIPALVLFSKLPMREAVGTSLVIIAAKSLIGFTGEHPTQAIDWTLISMLSAFAIGGIFIGMALSKKIDGARLKPLFGWFVLFMGIYIIINETMIRDKKKALQPNSQIETTNFTVSSDNHHNY